MSNAMVKGVCLHDNGSTHGTSVGGRRLQPQVDYALSNGEIITFGVRVTSGERKATFSYDCVPTPYIRAFTVGMIKLTRTKVSYPAREFRFNFEWRLWRFVSRILCFQVWPLRFIL